MSGGENGSNEKLKSQVEKWRENALTAICNAAETIFTMVLRVSAWVWFSLYLFILLCAAFFKFDQPLLEPTIKVIAETGIMRGEKLRVVKASQYATESVGGNSVADQTALPSDEGSASAELEPPNVTLQSQRWIIGNRISVGELDGKYVVAKDPIPNEISLSDISTLRPISWGEIENFIAVSVKKPALAAVFPDQKVWLCAKKPDDKSLLQVEAVFYQSFCDEMPFEQCTALIKIKKTDRKTLAVENVHFCAAGCAPLGDEDKNCK